MKRPTILSGLLFAIAAAGVATFVWPVMADWLGVPLALRAAMAMLACAQLAYHLWSRGGKVGVLALTAANLAIVPCVVLGPFTLTTAALLLTALAWGNRSLLHHRSLPAAALDGALSFAGLIFAGYVLRQSGSVAAAVWAFLLVQALWVMIPALGRQQATAESDGVDPFTQSRRQAESALRSLTFGD